MLSKTRKDRIGKFSLHPSGVKITLSGGTGEDAKHYQERDLRCAIERIKQRRKHLTGT